MFVLTGPEKSIELYLESPANNVQIDISVSYEDITASATSPGLYKPGENNLTSNDISVVTVVNGSTGNIIRLVKQIIVYNNDNTSVIFVLQFNTGSIVRKLYRVPLDSGKSFTYQTDN